MARKHLVDGILICKCRIFRFVPLLSVPFLLNGCISTEMCVIVLIWARAFPWQTAEVQAFNNIMILWVFNGHFPLETSGCSNAFALLLTIPSDLFDSLVFSCKGEM